MFTNYLKIAYRNLSKRPFFSLINMAGLSIGIASLLLIYLYIQFEKSYDDFHLKKERIYRIIEKYEGSDSNWNPYVSGDPIAELKKSVPGVDNAAKIIRCGSPQIRVGTESFTNINMKCTNSDFFDIFSFEMLSGNPSTSLDEPNTVVITKSLSIKMFGDKNPIGEILSIDLGNEERTFTITGIIEDVPENSHLQFDFLLSYESLLNTRRCLTCGQLMYVLLQNRTNPDVVSTEVLRILKNTTSNATVEAIELQPIEEIHFSNIYAEKKGNLHYVYILSGIATIILLITCINYMNMATANYSNRSKEIGIRKVIGGFRKQLLFQFYSETFFLTLLSLPIAIITLLLAIPYFNQLFQTSIDPFEIYNLHFLLAVIVVLLFTSLMAGSYPALFLSSLQPSSVLKGNKSLESSILLRKGLVGFQFLVSIVMISLAILIFKQLNLLQSKDLNFATENIAIIPLDNSLQRQIPTIKNLATQISGIQNISAGFRPPGPYGFGARYQYHSNDNPQRNTTFVLSTIDSEFIQTFGVKLLAGRNISDDKPEDGTIEAIINETSMKVMGWEEPGEAINQKIDVYKVVGVSEDFNFEPLYNDIQPLLMQQNTYSLAYTLAIRFNNADFSHIRIQIESLWEKLGSKYSVEYTLLNESIKEAYKNEQRTASVISLFLFISIVISSLGLVGLATYLAEKKSNEIGVRKVFGASFNDIAKLMIHSIIKTLALSFLISIPIVLIVGRMWLNNFAYKTEINIEVFILSLTLLLSIAFIATAFQITQAARKNPIEVIKYE